MLVHDGPGRYGRGSRRSQSGWRSGPYGAGFVAAKNAAASAIVDPHPFAAGDIAGVYRKYPHIAPVLPAVGYCPEQLEALARTITAAGVDAVVSGTPADLSALISIDTPIIRARCEFAEMGAPKLSALIEDFLAKQRTG